MKNRTKYMRKEEYLNTNEVMRDFEFHLRLTFDLQGLDFESREYPVPAE